MLIKELPLESQPVYRSQLLGFGGLCDYELLQLVYSFRDTETALLLLAKGGNLQGLAKLSIEEMQTVPGIGVNAALAIKAALEVGRRMGVEQVAPQGPMNSADRVHNTLRYMEDLEQEHMVVLLLNTRLRLIAVETVHIGTVDTCKVRVSELFKLAVRRNATAVIVAHNHPSGHPEPSPEDIHMTKYLCAAGSIIDIQVLDHVIIGKGRYYSLKDHGEMPAYGPQNPAI